MKSKFFVNGKSALSVFAGIGVATVAAAFINPMFVSATSLDVTQSALDENAALTEENIDGMTYENPIQVLNFLEEYDPDQKNYRQMINDRVILRTSVQRNKSSVDPVTIKNVSNSSLSVTKDGKEYTKSISEFKDVGDYTVTVSGEDGGVQYTANFSFSIYVEKEKPASTDSEAESDKKLLTEEDFANMSDKELETPVLDDEDTGELTEEELDQKTQNAMDELDNETGNAIKEINGDVLGGMKSYYDHQIGCYIFSMANDTISIGSSVSFGTITNDDVYLQLPEGLEHKIYKDGELLTGSEARFNEPGFYKVMFRDMSSPDFKVCYPLEKDYPFICFRIVSDAVNDIDIYNAPKNNFITRIIKDGELLAGEVTDEEGNVTGTPVTYNYYPLNADGVYVFTVKDSISGETQQLEITKDTQAPEFDVTTKNGVATVTYYSNDIESVEVIRNNTDVSNQDNTVIKGKGNYVITVTDVAGNKTSKNFYLNSQYNISSVLAIVLFIGIIGAGIWLVRRTKTKIVVR